MGLGNLNFVCIYYFAAAAGWGTFLLLGGVEGWTMSDRLLGAIGTAVIGGVAVVVYIGVLALLRAPELAVVGPILRKLRGR